MSLFDDTIKLTLFRPSILYQGLPASGVRTPSVQHLQVSLHPPTLLSWVPTSRSCCKLHLPPPTSRSPTITAKSAPPPSSCSLQGAGWQDCPGQSWQMLLQCSCRTLHLTVSPCRGLSAQLQLPAAPRRHTWPHPVSCPHQLCTAPCVPTLGIPSTWSPLKALCLLSDNSMPRFLPSPHGPGTGLPVAAPCPDTHASQTVAPSSAFTL